MANELTGLIEKIERVITSDRNIKVALSSTLVVHKRRIFEQGLDGNGAKIGTYSHKPISISKKNQARATGKTYFKGGYDEYKKLVGKNPGYVNLRNTDQMMMDYGLVGSSGSYGFGFQNDFNYQKSEWLEKKYQKEVFTLSDIEASTLQDILYQQLITAL